MKKILFIIIWFISSFTYSFWEGWPDINCAWLPWCQNWEDIKDNLGQVFIVFIIEYFIQFVLAFAVFALIFSGILYILSGWEEEKTNKAKKWIIWSLVWVFVSISSWWIIWLLNNLTVSN